jgi:hypothetical protein
LHWVFEERHFNGGNLSACRLDAAIRHHLKNKRNLGWGLKRLAIRVTRGRFFVQVFRVGGKFSAEFSPKFSPEKMSEISAPEEFVKNPKNVANTNFALVKSSPKIWTTSVCNFQQNCKGLTIAQRAKSREKSPNPVTLLVISRNYFFAALTFVKGEE